MRKVIIPKDATPPQEWLDEANALTAQLRSAATTAERKAIIEANQKLWRDERVRDWLLKLFHNKCWYTEASESVSAMHVDHYRPHDRTAGLAIRKMSKKTAIGGLRLIGRITVLPGN
jgi:hypothetical protein